MDDEAVSPAMQTDYAALIATGERVTEQMEALRADLAAAETRAVARVAAAEAKGAKDLKAERMARRRSQRRLLLVLAFDMAVTIVLATVLSGQADTNHRLADTNRQIQESLSQNYITQQQQAETRVRVLCPLYTLLLASVDPSKRAALPTDQQKAYDSTVGVIQKGYATLGCTPPLP